MLTFTLAAFLALSNGEVHEFDLDTGLTYEDCLSAVSPGRLASDIAWNGKPNVKEFAVVCKLENDTKN